MKKLGLTLLRTQPELPQRSGPIKTKCHDYIRHGIDMLFAAFDCLQEILIEADLINLERLPFFESADDPVAEK